MEDTNKAKSALGGLLGGRHLGKCFSKCSPLVGDGSYLGSLQSQSLGI